MPTRRKDGINVIEGYDCYGKFALAAKDFADGSFRKYEVISDNESHTIFYSVDGSNFEKMGESTDMISVGDIAYNALKNVLRQDINNYEENVNKDLIWS